MGNEWRLVSFGDLYAEPSRNGLTKPKKVRGEGVKFVNMGEIFAHDRMSSISCDRAPLTEKESLASLLKPLDLLFARQSLVLSGAGKCSLFMGDTEPVAFESHLIRVRLEQTKVVPEFFYYFFKSPLGKDSIYSIVEQGAGASGVRGSDLANLNVPLPPLPEQKAIAHVLGTLDDRIELNRRMNETLEAMAQALFKSWFVDFDPVIDNALASGKEIPAELSERAAVRAALGDKRQPLPPEIRTLFPDEFTDSPKLGWIPKGWEVGVVGDILERLNVKKRYKKKDVADHGVVPVYEQGANLLLGYHNGVAEIEAALEAPAFIFGDHTCVTKLSCEPFSISENVIPLKGKKYPTIWVYYAIQGKQSFEEYRHHWMELVIKPIVLPSVELGEAYCVSVKDGLLKNMKLSHQQPVLTRIRDTLLPKLLSGEIRIPDAEKMVEELAL